MQMKELAVLIKPIIKQIGNVEIQDRFLDQQKGKIQDWRNLSGWVFMSGTSGKCCLRKELNTCWNKYKCCRQKQHLKPVTEVFSYLCGVSSLKCSRYIPVELYSSILHFFQNTKETHVFSASLHFYYPQIFNFKKYCLVCMWTFQV